MKYLHLFDTESAFTEAYNGSDYHEPWVSYTDETEGQEHVDYNKVPVDIWVDLTGYQYMSYPSDNLRSISQEPDEFPNSNVFVKEPDGTIHEYECTSVTETSGGWTRDLTPEERQQYGGQFYFFYKSFEYGEFSWNMGMGE